MTDESSTNARALYLFFLALTTGILKFDEVVENQRTSIVFVRGLKNHMDSLIMNEKDAITCKSLKYLWEFFEVHLRKSGGYLLLRELDD